MPTNLTTLRLAVSQSHTLSTAAATLSALAQTAARASTSSIDVLLFPEAYLGGYPRGATFGIAVGARDQKGREQYLRHFKEAIDLGDTPRGEGERWVRREIGEEWQGADWKGNKEDGKVVRGDGTREELERVARETGVFLVVGLVERAGGTLYCGVVYVCPRLGVIGKRRKVMPTGTERLVWGQGQPSSLRAVTTTIRGVKLTLAAAICWENYMPLLRHSLYSQNVNLYLAPTADARDTWVPLMRTVACEGRCFVLSANQCVRKGNLPEWIGEEKKEEDVLEDGKWSGRRYRRKSSLVTEDGHEIALPAGDDKENFEEAVSVGEGSVNGRAHDRKASFVTEDGHEIIIPSGGDKSGPGRTLSNREENTNGRGCGRKASIVTEDGHAIILPTDGGKDSSGKAHSDREDIATYRRQGRKASFLTEDGHEIVIPSDSGGGKYGTTLNDNNLKKTKTSESKPDLTEFACRGGSCIISPSGDILAGPSWEKEEDLLVVDVDFDDCLRGRLDLDVAGSYSRNDAFKLTVEGLDLNPPL